MDRIRYQEQNVLINEKVEGKNEMEKLGCLIRIMCKIYGYLIQLKWGALIRM